MAWISSAVGGSGGDALTRTTTRPLQNPLCTPPGGFSYLTRATLTIKMDTLAENPAAERRGGYVQGVGRRLGGVSGLGRIGRGEHLDLD